MEIILSSSKRGYGVRELMSNSQQEYWNSDDILPHSITISFPYKTYIHSVEMYLTYSIDESYTPERITVYYNSKADSYTFSEPEGRKEIAIGQSVTDIHIVILNNHSDGKDSHVRLLKVLKGPEDVIQYDPLKFR